MKDQRTSQKSPIPGTAAPARSDALPKGGILDSNTEKDPAEWTTGDEPMTGAQASYLKTLCEEAGEDFSNELTKAEASIRIDELRQRTGRGLSKSEVS